MSSVKCINKLNISDYICEHKSFHETYIAKWLTISTEIFSRDKLAIETFSEEIDVGTR